MKLIETAANAHMVGIDLKALAKAKAEIKRISI